MKNIITNLIYILGFLIVLTSCHNTDMYVVSELSNEHEEGIVAMTSSSDWRLFNNVEELSEISSHVVRAVVLDYRVESRDLSIPVEASIERARRRGIEFDDDIITALREAPQRNTIITIYRLEIIESFKGGLEAGEIIEMMQEGGVLDGSQSYEWIVHNGIEMRVGVSKNYDSIPLQYDEDLIFFLYLWEYMDFPYIIVNPFQGAYRFVDSIPNDLIRGMNIELKNAHPHSRSNFTITVQDLMNIAEANFPTNNSEDDEATPKTTREKLALAIQEAEERMQSMYTSISWARLLNALRDARNVYNNLNATQLEIDDVTDSLRLAIETLEELPPEPEPVDRTELIAAIEAAEARVQAMYTPISWARLQNPLRDARNIRDNANATQEQIELAMETLITALNGLVSR